MRLKAWRDLKGLTCAEIGEKLGMAEATVFRHEIGLRLPSPAVQGLYEEITEGAVTPRDWNELWSEPDSVAARARDAANEKKRKAAA